MKWSGLNLPKEGLGKLVFYRGDDPLLIGVEPEVIVNDKLVGRSRFGEMFAREAKPGFYRIHTTHDANSSITVELRSSEILFVRIFPELQLTGFRLVPRLVVPEAAYTELSKLQPAPE